MVTARAANHGLWSYGIRSRLHDAGLCSGLVCHAILRLASDSPTSGFPTPSRLDSRLRAFEFFASLNSVSEAVRMREQQGACNVRSGGGRRVLATERRGTMHPRSYRSCCTTELNIC